MTTAMIFHDVQDGAVWAKAWKKGPGSRHEMFGKLGIKCRNFRDPNNPIQIAEGAAYQLERVAIEGNRGLDEVVVREAFGLAAGSGYRLGVSSHRDRRCFTDRLCRGAGR